MTEVRGIKINVESYAKTNEISVLQANEEIQSWLFDYGCCWLSDSVTLRLSDDHGFLYVGVDGTITWSPTGLYRWFNDSKLKEVFVQREQRLVLTMRKESSTILYENKRYDKTQFMNAINSLQIIG